VQKIEDQAFISNCKTSALIDLAGEMKWMCAPRFDSPACFASLLGDEENGHWFIRPSIPYQTKRKYVQDTFVLETEFVTSVGTVKLTDFMPYQDPGVHVFRRVEGMMGSVPMEIVFKPRFYYGSLIPLFELSKEGEFTAVSGPDRIHLKSPINLILNKEMLHQKFNVSKNETLNFRMTWTPSYEERKTVLEIEDVFDETIKSWQEWIRGNKISDSSLRPEFCKRSMLTLKALTYEPTGSLVAAATTSLPEEPGGMRNWDYRFCWPRDAAMSISAVAKATGRTDEVASWRQWLQRATAGVPKQLRTVYGLRGEVISDDIELDWLEGFNQSKPVRIGNSANRQLQLDIYVSVVEIFCKSRNLGLPPINNDWEEVKEVLEYLKEIWTNADEGIWEIRGEKRHFVQSKLMVWMAFRLAVDVAKEMNLEAPIEEWEDIMSTIHKEICEKGFNKEKNCFVQYYGASEVDANLLLLPLLDFLPISDSRIINTIKVIEDELLLEEGLLMRYRPSYELEGLPSSRPKAFLLCSSWLGQCYQLMGRREDALAVLEKLYSLCNDVGLLAEQYDPQRQCQLGNFPQAFSHIALISLEISLNGKS